MPKMHLKQPGCPYSASEQFTKNKERTKKSTETRDSTDIYQNELEKVCFQHDYGLGKFWRHFERTKEQLLINYYVIKDLTLLKNLESDGYQRRPVSMV